MMEVLGITAVAAITVICYLAAEIVKVASLDNKWIPVICGISGGILGIAALFWMPDFPVQDVLSAAAVGIVSGLAATGANQIFKQFRS